MRQEVAKRDKGIDELKVRMQQMQEQHGKQIRNLQGIHNQELEAKDREISWLNSLYLKKRINGFLMFKEQFDKLRHSLRRPTEEPSKSREFKL